MLRMKSYRGMFLVCMLVVLGFSCSLVADGHSNRYSRQQCGDPFWISQVGDSYTYQVRRGSADASSIDIEFKGFSGRDTVWELISNCNVMVPYELVVSDLHASEFKVVLVNEATGEVVTVVRTRENQQEYLVLVPGRYKVKLVGYAAAGQLSMRLDVPLGVIAVDRFSNRW
ncbi:MAG: hypothetical protein CVV48_11865 [Spirochaetae bacterium HGW-Spirochaetae-4]|nr:MAG: hypothetical protein CVV48_11865 [Spirochaetae bacterium HGW-Spirochaetae-4]